MAVPYSGYLFGSIKWYSFLIVFGAFLAVLLACREEKTVGLKKDTVLDLSLWVLPVGIIGARIYYVIFAWDSFRDDLWSVFRIWEGGIAIYGALIGGFLAVLVFSRARKINLLLLCDVVCPGVILAQAIGRWGNYFNMEAYGDAIENPALQFFPFAVKIPEEAQPWHMATFFYESLWNLLVFLFLIIGRRKNFRKSGDVFFFYTFLYACGRLVIEDFRTDSLYASSSVRVSQLLSVIICILLLIWYFLSLKERRKTPAVICFVLSMIFALPVLGYCLNLFIHPTEMTLLHRFLLLGSYACMNLVTLFLIYGKTKTEEVRYAVHKA